MVVENRKAVLLLDQRWLAIHSHLAYLTEQLRCVRLWPTSAFQYDSDTAAHAAAHFTTSSTLQSSTVSTRQCCRFRLHGVFQISAISLWHSIIINNEEALLPNDEICIPLTLAPYSRSCWTTKGILKHLDRAHPRSITVSR